MNTKRVISATKQAVWQRNYRRARERAMTKLAHHYPETYKELLEQEKIADVTNGKAWLDIDGNTGTDVDISTLRSREDGGEEPASTYEGNDGAKA